MANYFVSDTHFGHRNILTYEPLRQCFDNIQEHDELLVHNWNSVVKKHDKVYHLGDVIFSKDMRILGRLNGQIRLVMGNHDTHRIDLMRPYFRKITGDRFMQVQGRSAVLSHIPVHPGPLLQRAEVNIHGHLHSAIVTVENGLPDFRYVNVSLEQIGMTPIHEDELPILL